MNVYQGKVVCGEFKRTFILTAESSEAAIETLYKYIEGNVRLDDTDKTKKPAREEISVVSLKLMTNTEILG